MIKNIQNALHYNWGDDCGGWHLVDSNELSVIREYMPPGTEEVYHYHKNAQQVFYILSGTAIFIIEGEEVEVFTGDSVHIEKKRPHCIKNPSTSSDLHFLVISQPKAHGDRYIV